MKSAARESAQEGFIEEVSFSTKNRLFLSLIYNLQYRTAPARKAHVKVYFPTKGYNQTFGQYFVRQVKAPN